MGGVVLNGQVAQIRETAHHRPAQAARDNAAKPQFLSAARDGKADDHQKKEQPAVLGKPGLVVAVDGGVPFTGHQDPREIVPGPEPGHEAPAVILEELEVVGLGGFAKYLEIELVGYPLRRGGQIVGAMSASGARAAEDAQAVRAGMAAIGIQP